LEYIKTRIAHKCFYWYIKIQNYDWNIKPKHVIGIKIPKNMEYNNNKNGIYNPPTYYQNKHTRKTHLLNSIHIWLVVSTPLENITQLGVLFPTYGKIQNVPNHQPDNIYLFYYFGPSWHLP